MNDLFEDNKQISDVRYIHLTLDEINELNERMEQSRYLKSNYIRNKQENYYYRCRDMGYRPDKPDITYMKELDKIELPKQLEMKKDEMYNVLISIDPTYYVKGRGWRPLNYTLDLLWKAQVKYYKQNFSHNLEKSKDRQYKQIVFTHLYKIKNHSYYNYLKKFYPDKLQDYFKPHLHIMYKIPVYEVEQFFNFINKYIKSKCNSAKLDWTWIQDTTQDQIRCMKYGYKFNSIYFTNDDRHWSC